MSKKKEETKAPTPVGFTAKSETNPQFSFQQFFDLMRISDALINFVNFVKQENFNADNIRYYFPEDLVEVKDDKGVITKQLRADFWTGVIVEELTKD